MAAPARPPPQRGPRHEVSFHFPSASKATPRVSSPDDLTKAYLDQKHRAAKPKARPVRNVPLGARVTPEEVRRLRRAFDRFDQDESGNIDVNEVGELMATFGDPLTALQRKRLIKAIDTDKSGTIEFEELLRWFGERKLVRAARHSPCGRATAG